MLHYNGYYIKTDVTLQRVLCVVCYSHSDEALKLMQKATAPPPRKVAYHDEVCWPSLSHVKWRITTRSVGLPCPT